MQTNATINVYKTIGRRVAIAVCVSVAAFVIFSQPEVTPQSTGAQSGASTQSAMRPPRIVGVDFIIPEMGTLNIERQRRCSISNLTNEQIASIEQIDTPSSVTFRSRLSYEVTGRLWFYDEGGNCREDSFRLIREQAFL